MPRSLPTRKIGINELQVVQRFAHQFVHLWDDALSAPRKRKSLAKSNAVIALNLLRDVCKGLGILDTELRIHHQRSDFDLSRLLVDLREAVGAMCAKIRYREAIGVDVKKYKAFDLRNPSFKPPSANEWKKAVRIAGAKFGGYLDTSSVAFEREWIDTVRKAAERLPKAPPYSTATPAVPDNAVQPRNLPKERFGPGYRSVHWYGKAYSFTQTQGACVEVLRKAWTDGTPEVAESTILEQAGSDGSKLRDVFRRGGTTHPAWGKMIVKGQRKDTFRLNAGK